MEVTHVLKVVCSNPSTVCWMGIFSHKFVINVCLKKTKINEKEAGDGLFLKKRSFQLSGFSRQEMFSLILFFFFLVLLLSCSSLFSQSKTFTDQVAR